MEGKIYNTHICIATYGCNFRGAVARECASESEKGEESKPERKGMSYSLDLKTVIEPLSITFFGSELQIAGAMQ